ncbi:MAG: hypothetical protein WB767_07040 [Nocardioides sp.]
MVTAVATPPVRRETRLVPVSGVWVGTTWIDDTVLEHCRRSAEGGFAFRVRSSEIAMALVAAGFAVRDTTHPTALQGILNAHDIRVAEAPSAATAPLGRCSSSHHLDPVEATVRGHRTRSADAADGTEPAALCARCADLLGDAGFFVAA